MGCSKIERDITTEYIKKGMSKKRATAIAGAVVGKIERMKKR
jgi:hypothetical protein